MGDQHNETPMTEERLDYALPDDHAEALNILREAAELEPWTAERGWIVSPRPNPYSVEAWAQRHRRDGHHPYPAPTAENPSAGSANATQTHLGPLSGAF